MATQRIIQAIHDRAQEEVERAEEFANLRQQQEIERQERDQRSILAHQNAIREHERLSAEVDDWVQIRNRQAMQEAQEAERIVDENESRVIGRAWEEMERISQEETRTQQRSEATRGQPNRRRRGHPNPPRP